ncbi:hypothetical protein TNCV_4160241 [Trichonephila clavipes]|nr:hypothetical protein TNCV_4160241 [Trichonephila clavipes]
MGTQKYPQATIRLLTGEAWAKGNAKVSPGHYFLPYGTPHTASMPVGLPTVLKAGLSQAEVPRWLQVVRKWFPVYGINSKQVIQSPGRSAKVDTEHQHLHRTTIWH